MLKTNYGRFYKIEMVRHVDIGMDEYMITSKAFPIWCQTEATIHKNMPSLV